MEPLESAVGQTCKVENREKKTEESVAVSASNISAKRTTFADSKAKGYVKQQGSQRCSAEEHFGKELSSAGSQSSQEKQCSLRLSRSYSYRLRHSNQQKPKQKGSLTGAKPTADLEVLASSLASPLQLSASEHRGDLTCKNSPHVPTAFTQTSQSRIEQLGGMLRKVPKSKNPGKYICHYCGRACAKPSVLKKHIRSHTGERPYPCIPCGFSFKTKSNLYKHKKSHAHNVKAGLAPFSEQSAACKGADQSSLAGEPGVHSDSEQSTDTDEEAAMFLNKGGPVPCISLTAERSALASGPDGSQSAEELIVTSKEVAIVVASEPGIPCTAPECPWITDVNISGHRSSGDEFPTIKQKLALRLTGKKRQESGPSMDLLSPHSKGSTDSGYFSRSESAEQQISPPNTNAKSYEEIMFGKFYKLGPRSRHAITMAMPKATGADQNLVNTQDKSDTMPGSGICKTSEYHKSCYHTKDEKLLNPVHQNVATFLGDNRDSQMKISSLSRQYHPSFCQITTGPVDAADAGPLVRSNSVPMAPVGSLSAPQGLQGSHSFDERMTSDPGFYRSSVGLRRLRRQAAFEFIAHEGHVEFDNSGTNSKSIFSPAGLVQLDENSPSLPNLKGHSSYSGGVEGQPEPLAQVRVTHHKQVTEIATRKRRKKKSVGDEEDFPVQHDNDFDSSVEMLAVDYDSKQEHQDAFRRAFSGTGQLYSVHREPENLSTGTCVAPDETVLISDVDRKTGRNVISVIQHTNSLSRPSSFEKSDSIDQAFLPLNTLTTQYSEQSDSEKPGEMHGADPKRSGNAEPRQVGGEPADHSYRLPHKLVRQANIQVPEIRVTEEPDKPIEGRDASIKESEKQVEDFQWPQRSETLSQLPAEKLPPKKKRLRLAEMEHSSGESSFESTCSSLSRSPSQESHLSPSSSFSMSFDREESGKSASPAKQDDFGKQSEFLTVPCSGRSLPVRNQSRQKEVRRSSSEQAACVLHSELPEIRSKSFDYGGLLSSSSLGDVHAGALAMTERRRGCLVRQAPLSIYPESPTQDKASDTKVKEERPERSSSPLLHSRWLSTASPDKTNSSPAYDVALSRKTEDGQRGGGMQKQRMSHLLEHGRSQSDRWAHEVPSKEFMQNINVGKSPVLPSQSAAFCQSESIQMQYLPRVPWSLSDLLSRAFTGSTGLLKPVQTVISHELAGSQPPPPDTSVPVRIQTQVPSHCSIMYTNVPQVVVTHSQSNSSVMAICHVRDNTLLTKSGSKDGVCHSLSNHGELVHYPLGKLQEAVPARMNTGIPLTLTSGTISTTDASGTGGNKRILSPANSMELFIETKQQKRVKEEKMYGQIVEELSAVELSNSRVTKASGKSQKPGLKNHGSGDYPKRMSVSPLLHLPATAVTLPTAELHLQEVGDIREGMQSPESLDIDDSSPPAAEIQEMMDCKIPLNILMETAANQDAILASTLLLTDVGNDKNFAQFPSLCTSTSVSWCFLNYTKPNTAQTCSVASVYGSWFVSSYNPNPPDLNTKTSLALLRSKQKKTTESYTVASMHQPGTSKVVSSLLWKQKFEKEKPEVMQLDVNKFEKKTKEVGVRERLSEGHRHKEASPKVAEPNRIKIFEGGYKSNEDYVYVRGRGRGKYICEECGIRCKKPSMLKKHIRTHTDVRPYVCKFCNFAFKTKGNLTKHMKSKAHMKKCVELGVSLTSVETTEAEEGDNADEGQRASWKSVRTGVITEHQFSDADDSEEAEEEADENEEDDDEDDEYEGDSTPRTRSRSTSPQPSGTPSVPVTASAVSPGTSSDLPYPAARAPLFGLSDIQLKRRGDRVCKAQMAEGQRSTQGVTSDEHEKSLNVTGSLDKACAPSQECSFPTTDFAPSSVASLGYDSSPQREPSPAPQRYLCPLRELLPQGHLRHVSPKKDISIRRGFSPRGHSSTDPLARPVSPGRDISCKRELSPRSRHCGSIRPVSPRRGMYHHGAPWSQGPNLQSELATVEKLDGHSDVNMEPRKSSLQSCRHLGEDHRSLAPPSPQQGLFSHLPLHSQVLVRTPVSTVPIGGIQMVPAAPLSAAGLLKSTLGESGLGAMPFCRSEASCKAGGNPPGMPDGPPSPAPQGEHVDVGDITDRVDAPDENVQICTKAIASLRISSEDAAAERTDGPPPSSPATHPHVNS